MSLSQDAPSGPEGPEGPEVLESRPKSTISYIPYNPVLENSYVPAMRRLISQELSEPYSIYVYRYFLYQWGDLCYLAMDPVAKGTQEKEEEEGMVGVVVSKLEPHRGGPLRGYIAMLAVQEEYRGRGIATRLVRMTIDKMVERGADEVYPVCFLVRFFFWSDVRVLTCGAGADRPGNRNHKYGCD